MASVHDVAAYILAECGPLGAVKLQKLTYYSQAWSLVWDGEPLFPEKIEAWDKGPVVRELFHEHKNRPSIDRQRRGAPTNLSDDQRATISAVLAFYGGRSGEWLSELTHREPPWLDTRTSSRRTANPVITTEAMRAFYSTYPATKRHIPVSVARGLDLIVTLPKDLVGEIVHGEPTEIVGLEEWLETGEGDPWPTKSGD
jgi:uncharacterized phage-associated protein